MTTFNHELHAYFPHKIIRDGQSDLLKDSYNTIKNKQILLAQAPTGLGKTASTLSVAVKYAMENNKKIFFLTNRHTQHKIAVETLKGIRKMHGKEVLCVDLIGKKWMCNQEVSGLYGTEFNEYCKASVEKGTCEFYTAIKNSKDLTIDAKYALARLQDKGPLHNEEIKIFSEGQGMCSYEMSIALAKKAQVIIGDYYYIFNPFIRETILKKLDIELEDVILIVDEGHNLPTRVTEMLSNNLTTTMLKNSISEAQKFHYYGMVGWLEHLQKVLTSFAKFDKPFDTEKLIRREQLESNVNMIINYDELIDELGNAAEEIRKKQKRSYLGGVVSFLEAWQGNDKGFSRILSVINTHQGKVIKLSYSCLDPSLVTKDVFDSIHSSIIMSGTLHPTSMYKDLFGIPLAEQKIYASPFPVENKLSIIIPETSTKFTSRSEDMYKQMAEICSKVSLKTPGNVAIFFPSYAIRNQVAQYIRTEKELLLEQPKMSKEEKEEMLNRFERIKLTGGLLLGVTGANFAEGVDFPGDLLNGVIVVGIPLARPDLKTKQTIDYYAQKFGKGWEYAYIFPAINKCLQSAGRCIRSESDKGVVIYLDERFAWSRYFNCFPKEGLIVSKNYEELLSKFFPQ